MSAEDLELEVRETFYDSVVEMFELDLSVLPGFSGTDHYYFTNFIIPFPWATNIGLIFGKMTPTTLFQKYSFNFLLKGPICVLLIETHDYRIKKHCNILSYQ